MACPGSLVPVDTRIGGVNAWDYAPHAGVITIPPTAMQLQSEEWACFDKLKLAQTAGFLQVNTCSLNVQSSSSQDLSEEQQIPASCPDAGYSHLQLPLRNDEVRQ